MCFPYQFWALTPRTARIFPRRCYSVPPAATCLRSLSWCACVDVHATVHARVLTGRVRCAASSPIRLPHVSVRPNPDVRGECGRVPLTSCPPLLSRLCVWRVDGPAGGSRGAHCEEEGGRRVWWRGGVGQRGPHRRYGLPRTPAWLCGRETAGRVCVEGCVPLGRAREWTLHVVVPPSPAARCPHCENKLAYFKQIQVRSADEPMTTFYKCTECGGRWNE